MRQGFLLQQTSASDRQHCTVLYILPNHLSDAAAGTGAGALLHVASPWGFVVFIIIGVLGAPDDGVLGGVLMLILARFGSMFSEGAAPVLVEGVDAVVLVIGNARVGLVSVSSRTLDLFLFPGAFGVGNGFDLVGGVSISVFRCMARARTTYNFCVLI